MELQHDNASFQICVDTNRIAYFVEVLLFFYLAQQVKLVLERIRQPYVILIDGLEHIFSHADIKASFCLPEQLQLYLKIVVTWGEDSIGDKDGVIVVLDSFDMESFAEPFFKR